jgi:hypothetical protein
MINANVSILTITFNEITTLANHGCGLALIIDCKNILQSLPSFKNKSNKKAN